jgi:hypothetical protein
LTESSVTTAGKFAQWYFADPGLRSAGATASIITCFSSGVRSRCPTLTPPESDGASLVPVVHPKSAKPTASGAIKLKLDICKARCVVEKSALFCLITMANIRQRRALVFGEKN